MEPAIIVDIDGTLADCKHRLHHVSEMTPDWDGFFSTLSEDPLIKWSANLIVLYHNSGYQIYLVTGRPERYREATEKWLNKYELPFTKLYMRDDGDTRRHDVVKRDILHKNIVKEGIEFVLDDSKDVVKMWREEGLICLHCNSF